MLNAILIQKLKHGILHECVVNIYYAAFFVRQKLTVFDSDANRVVPADIVVHSYPFHSFRCITYKTVVSLKSGKGIDVMGLLPMDSDILSAYDDRVFKLMLTAPEAIPALMLVSSAIINQPVVNVVVRNNELPVTDIEEKAETFDVNCKINDDSQADIEMQGSPMKEERGSNHANVKARSIYNVCDLHSSQSSKGIPYDKLIRSYQVMFCKDTVFPHREGFIHSFSMRSDFDNELLHDGICSMFIELSKLQEVIKKPVEQMTDMERVSVFLRYADDPDYREIVNKVIESREGLIVASEKLMSISKDERERAKFRSRRMAIADQESNMATAVLNSKIDMAKIMLTASEPIEKIMKYTGLTRKEVEKLRDADK